MKITIGYPVMRTPEDSRALRQRLWQQLDAGFGLAAVTKMRALWPSLVDLGDTMNSCLRVRARVAAHWGRR